MTLFLVPNRLPTVLAFALWLIEALGDAQSLQLLEVLPKFVRMVILRYRHVRNLMDQHIHCRVYIVSIKADVNLVTLVDVRTYDAILFPVAPRDDGWFQNRSPYGVTRCTEDVQRFEVPVLQFNQHFWF